MDEGICGETIVEFKVKSEKTQTKRAAIRYSVDQNKTRDTNRYQISEDQDQRREDQVLEIRN